MIMKRLSLVYPVITYRAKMKRNLGYVVNEDWIIGQLYTDAVGNKYLLAGTPENEDQQRFYEVKNLRQETVGILSPFKTNHENAIFDGDIISVTAYNGTRDETVRIETGREVSKWFRYTTEIVMETLAEAAGYHFVVDAYDEKTGAAAYRFMTENEL